MLGAWNDGGYGENLGSIAYPSVLTVFDDSYAAINCTTDFWEGRVMSTEYVVFECVKVRFWSVKRSSQWSGNDCLSEGISRNGYHQG